jgi:acetoin utilization deacetylase AcuC-like enzyme
MGKFQQLQERLLADGVIQPQQVRSPDFPPQAWLEQVHTPEYIQAYCTGTLPDKAQRRIGLPWSAALAQRTRLAVGGTVLTARLALEHGLACNTAGGTHHAFPEYGSGFCIFNDCAIAARVLQQEGRVHRVLMVDLDVHQGDGTAFIFQTDPTVFTFSMHCDSNFPSRKQCSDLDVALPEGMADEAYLQTLAHYLPDVLSLVKPDLVFYNAGVDPHEGDRLGKLALTTTGLYRREMQVLSTCIGHGYPVACVIGGGYAEDLASLAYLHSLVHRAASEVYYHARLT